MNRDDDSLERVLLHLEHSAYREGMQKAQSTLSYENPYSSESEDYRQFLSGFNSVRKKYVEPDDILSVAYEAGALFEQDIGADVPEITLRHGESVYQD